VQQAVKTTALPWLVLAGSLLVSFGFWHWADHVLVPVYTANAQARGWPIGNNSDLYPVWLTAREVLLEGRIPYSAQLTADIQRGFYGKQVDPRNPGDPRNLQAFAYPLYVIFLMAPTVTLPFATVVEVFRVLLLLSTASTVPLWLHVIGLRLPPPLTASIVVLAVSNFPVLLEDRQQNLSALVVLLLAGSIAACRRNWFTLSGFLLALSTIKPQLSALLIGWLLVWALSEWHQRGRLVWSFVISFLSLLTAATAISPHWAAGFWAAVGMYRSYLSPSILEFLLPSMPAAMVIAALLVFLGFVCWKRRKAPIGSIEFAWTLALLVTVTVTITIGWAHYQLLLIPALLLLMASADARHSASFLTRVLTKGTFACLLWQWGTALILALCSMFVPIPRLRIAAELPLYTSPPLCLFALFAVVGSILSMQSSGKAWSEPGGLT
jgi:hypothetical protein